MSREEKKPQAAFLLEPGYHEHAGGLLLLAAANETALLAHLADALPPEQTQGRPPLVGSSAAVRQRLLLTLLFLGVVGLHRTWDLRGYTADGLALLTGRKRAYGYRYTEAFLSQVAHADGAERLTDTLAQWTTHLWHTSEEASEPSKALTCYIDGHRKPVYSDALIPRGLVGRLAAILGCRALVLLHDKQGHPLLATTHRGDQHLTIGLPSILARYEQITDDVRVSRIIVDREGMAIEFLAALHEASRTVVTILRTDQYRDLASFTAVGEFVALSMDAQGQVLREVASARITFPRPDHPGDVLSLQVALIRDLRRLVPVERGQEDADLPRRWDADRERSDPRWWEDAWQATPAPATQMTPRLIPIVTTAATCDAVTLAQTYIHRWPAQENVIKDFLLPLGLDTNHGFAKTPVINSEVNKKRETLEKRCANVQRFREAAREKAHRASGLETKLWKQAKEHGEKVYRTLNDRLQALEAQGVTEGTYRAERRKLKAEADAELEPLWQRVYRVRERSHQESSKHERYCREQRELLRALEDLAAKERVMHELDNRKDQIMTVCKLALQIYRYRRVSTPTERQQIKWVVFGLFITFGSILLAQAILFVILPLFVPVDPLSDTLGQTLSTLLLLFFPLPIGFAILRYRL